MFSYPDADGKIHAIWYEDGNVAPIARSFQFPNSFMVQLIRNDDNDLKL